jgi:GNAT superfamily N-acetyltransferase
VVNKQEQEPIRPPEKLTSTHQIEDFDSGIEQLGYYCLSNGAVANNLATGKVRRNMPDPIPVMIIGRLAVDRRWQSKGIGKGLLRDAILRTLKASEIAGIRAILVHAISEEAKQFYEQYRFTASSLEPLTLMIKINDAVTSLGLPK